jgi:4,5-dihydroxyphthalate decarboxylase
MTEALRLTAAIGSYPHTQALCDGTLRPEGAWLDLTNVMPIGEVFKRMCRDLEFDLAEMSITGYLLARVYNKGFTALPVFPVRGFPQSHVGITVNTGAGVTTPADLAGKRVGSRAYTGTAGLWVRGVLAREYGVDLSSITWVAAEEEHVLEYRADAPQNVVYALDADLSQMLLEGDIAAGIGLNAQGPQIRPLIQEARNAAKEYCRRTGIYQINHTIVVRDSLLDQHHWLAASLIDAFEQSKRFWLDSVGSVPLVAELGFPTADPLPYGVDANRRSLDALVDYACGQRILPRPYPVEELFPYLGS